MESTEDPNPELTQLHATLRFCAPNLNPIALDASVLEKGLTALPDGLSNEDMHQAISDLEAYQIVPV